MLTRAMAASKVVRSSTCTPPVTATACFLPCRRRQWLRRRAFCHSTKVCGCNGLRSAILKTSMAAKACILSCFQFVARSETPSKVPLAGTLGTFSPCIYLVVFFDHRSARTSHCGSQYAAFNFFLIKAQKNSNSHAKTTFCLLLLSRCLFLMSNIP